MMLKQLAAPNRPIKPNTVLMTEMSAPLPDGDNTEGLIQHGHSPPALTSNPARIAEEFPQWLERVSSKLPGGIILVIDSLHMFQNAEMHMKWLLDPLPVDTRIVATVDGDTCPLAWRAWPSVRLDPLSNRCVREVLRAAGEAGLSLTMDQEEKILTRCRTTLTCNSLYVTMCLRRCRTTLTCNSLYVTMCLDRCLLQVLQYIYVSRNGMRESELIALLPGELTWNYWAPLTERFHQLSVLSTSMNGLLEFTQEEVREGGLHMLWGKYSTADALCKQALDIYENALGPQHHLVARELDMLAMLCQKQDKLDQAESLYARAVSIHQRRVKVPRRNHVGEKADMLKRRLVKLEQVALDRASPELARSLNELGVLFYLQNNHQMAEKLFEHSLEIRESLLGPRHPDCAQSLYNLAGFYNDSKLYDKAERFYESALSIRTNLPLSKGDKAALQACISHLSMFQAAFTRGRCGELLDYWKFTGAEQSVMADVYFAAIKQQEEEAGRRGDDTTAQLARVANLYEALGIFLKDLGLLKQSVTPLQRALEVREMALDPDHPSVAQVLHQLAGLHMLWGKYSTADALCKQALDIYENALGPQHHLVARELDMLAMLCQKQDKLDQAESLYARAVSIHQRRVKVPRRNHGITCDDPAVASFVKHLAWFCVSSGKLAKARAAVQTGSQPQE
ncbi:PREDICTED: nephrocystin-3-like [Priapulus caudatus]|uniref:Nephrocystin-3-like n=1 Tax=Priapulus caudatus TaxID=37621 RepID=A0ABM1F4M8_PRICU|nr:PREDICTED: nephrocystin-3-like [Priapulus caudatus]